MSNLLAGTVTFLFTDIEGSTKRWEAHPQQMRAALQRHDAILRTAMEAHCGYVFKTIGDAFCTAFASPNDAFLSSLRAQEALKQEIWPQEISSVAVRMALHTGTPDEWDGDYFGQPVNRVARLLSAGHGGQILLSLSTYELVRDQLPQGVELRDMGERRLRDLFRPEHVYQVVADGLPSDFPPLKTLDARPNNLLAQPNPLIGREEEVRDIASLLRGKEVRLLTLTGTGGTGKTRLGLQVAAEMVDEFDDGAMFVDLSPLLESALVVPTIARTLGVQEQGGGTPILDTLKEYLKERQMLLVLDNFEQVMDAAPQVAQLLAACPKLKVLVTSRVPLRVRGEHEYAVPSLSLPDVRKLPLLEQLTQYEAVNLFIERARAIRADFRVTNDNAPAVAEICVRLDGLPLAIELAAARIRMLPPQALLTRLSNRLKMLTGGARELSARQQTLRGAIDWSYDLLGEGEKQLFRRMAVFAGGCTLEAIDAVCNADGAVLVDVLDGVESLVSKNLLRQEGMYAEPRLVMLETIHEYAREKLKESEEGEALRKEHACYFLNLAELVAPELLRMNQIAWMERLEQEHDNLRGALTWSTRNDIGTGMKIAIALETFWYRRGYGAEGAERLGKLLDEASQFRDSHLKAKALYTVGHMLEATQGYGNTKQYFEQSLVTFREWCDKRYTAYALNSLALQTGLREGNIMQARAMCEEAMALCREIEDRWGMAVIAYRFAQLAQFVESDYAVAQPLYEQSFELYKQVGDTGGMALPIHNLAQIFYLQGDYAAACNMFRESLKIHKASRNKARIAMLLYSLGMATANAGDLEAARALYGEAFATGHELGEMDYVAAALRGLGDIARAEGAYEEALSLYRRSLNMFKESGSYVGDPPWVMYCIGYANLGQGRFEEALQHFKQALRDMGSSASGSYQLAERASCLAGLGAAIGVFQQADAGVRIIAAADKVFEQAGGQIEPIDIRDYQRVTGIIRGRVTEAAWEQAWQEGWAMSMEEAMAYALEETTSRPT
jgi:predicted ATPase/class 3 adenylate cyclase